MGTPETQDLFTRIGALEHALALSLRQIAKLSGENAKREIESLRDQSISDFKNSGVSTEREMEHAKIVRPAIEVLEAVFEHALRKLTE
jgi:chaperonin GroEL (HSP60 family)